MRDERLFLSVDAQAAALREAGFADVALRLVAGSIALHAARSG